MAIKRPGLGIQSKLLIMLLLVSIASAVVIGTIGFVSGRQSLQTAAFNQLTSLRESRAREIERTFAGIESGVILDSRNGNTVAASVAFNQAFAELNAGAVTPEQQAAVAKYYTDEFVPALEKSTGQTSDAAAFIPKTPAETYLQYYYSLGGDFDQNLATDTAGDPSAWSAAHAQYQDTFRGMIDQLGYEDVLLLNTTGDVVYSAYAGVDLGTNVRTGPYSGTVLASAYEDVMRSNVVNYVTTTDFDRYQPSLNVPTSWVVSPVGEAGNITGAIAVQLPISTVNDVMTGDDSWETDGLGKTGEVYMVGPDKLMRSVPRELIQNPQDYYDSVVSAGTSPEVAQREVDVKGAILLQPTDTPAVNAALQGKTGTIVSSEYNGRESLVAYAPLQIHGLDWVIIAAVDSSEAFEPVNVFTRNLLISLAALILIVSLLSLVLAQVFTRPLRRLGTAVERVAAGDVGFEVDDSSRDEFGDLGSAFNGMSRSLRIKSDLLEEQRLENERLLLTLMPETVAKRYREGEETIAQDHDDVAVLFADILGFEDYSSTRKSDAALADLNTIVRGFDEAADRLGIERVRTLRDGYLASSGLVVPRVDNARRALDFAIEMRGVLDRFNRSTGATLALRAGVDSGTVTSGLVGKQSLAYDLWGDAVNLAHRVQGASSEPGILVSQRVYDVLRDSYTFTASDKVGNEQAWRLADKGA